MLADELSCLSFWLIQDDKKKGYFEFNELRPLLEVNDKFLNLKAFRFEIEPFTLSNFKREFKFLLGNNPGEIRGT